MNSQVECLSTIKTYAIAIGKKNYTVLVKDDGKVHYEISEYSGKDITEKEKTDVFKILNKLSRGGKKYVTVKR